MEVSDLPRLVRNAGRFQEVVAVLAKYELAPWLSKVQADWVRRYFRSADGQQISDLAQPVKVRMALTELGTTFIKLGQILSTRPDLVGPEIAAELCELQSSTPPDGPETVVETIRGELGELPDKLFGRFDPTAFASASIGQVHKAILPDGTDVVVKVQHAGIEERIRNDLDILLELAKLAETYSTDLARYRPESTAIEFRKTLMNELDFTREQRNAKRFQRTSPTTTPSVSHVRMKNGAQRECSRWISFPAPAWRIRRPSSAKDSTFPTCAPWRRHVP